jgi:hypothetical protein
MKSFSVSSGGDSFPMGKIVTPLPFISDSVVHVIECTLSFSLIMPILSHILKFIGEQIRPFPMLHTPHKVTFIGTFLAMMESAITFKQSFLIEAALVPAQLPTFLPLEQPLHHLPMLIFPHKQVPVTHLLPLPMWSIVSNTPRILILRGPNIPMVIMGLVIHHLAPVKGTISFEIESIAISIPIAKGSNEQRPILVKDLPEPHRSSLLHLAQYYLINCPLVHATPKLLYYRVCR